MDKLKAIQYFALAAEAGSLAQAAHRLEISVQAVQKVVTALEATLGVTLLERNSRGVRLTPAGMEYLDRCRRLLGEAEELTQAERSLKGASERPSGTLAVAAHSQLAHHVLLPALPRFHGLYPDIDIDLRTVHRITDVDAQSADVLLLHGWPEVPPEFVHRNLGGARSLVMASAEHWAAFGVPRHPEDLAKYTCLLMRNPAGILLDLWEFKRDAQTVQVPVRGWMSSNAREAVLDLVLAGHGVGRFTEITTRDHVQSGRLVPVLLDWEVQGGPPLNLLFKGSARRAPRLRVFVDYLLDRLRDMEAVGGYALSRVSTDRPAWHLRGYAKASATMRRQARD